MKKFLTSVLVACLAAIALISVPTAASANGGSDGATPYSVGLDGIRLPDGDVFTAGSHVNVKTNKGNFNIHFEKKYADPSDAEWRNRPFDHNDPRNQFYGQSFLPWEALFNAKDNFCVTWVQIHGYNQHFGEGGQDPVGPGCTNPNPPKTEYGDWTSLNFTCDSKVGDTLTRTREVTVTTFYFNGKVKDIQKTTETEDYIVTETDVTYPTSDGRDCRTDVVPVVPTLELAYATCVAEKVEYVPAILTIPTVANGVWKIGDTEVSGQTYSLERDKTLTLTFTVTDGKLFRVSDAPTPGDGSFWTAVKDGNSITFTVTPNVVQDLEDCNLANSGMDAPVVAFSTAAVLMLVGGAVLLFYRKRSAVAVDSE